MEQFIFSTLKQKQTLDYHHWDETDTLHLAQIEDLLLLLLLLLQQFKLQYKTCFRNSKDSFDNFDFVELEEARRKLTVIVNLLTLNSYFKCCCHKNLSIIIFTSKLLCQASWKTVGNLEEERVKLEKRKIELRKVTWNSSTDRKPKYTGISTNSMENCIPQST